MPLTDRYRGCLLGLACGDAVGTTVEFQPRGTFAPVTDMLGGGPFRLPPGAWTDDTSMALCLASSLLEVGGFDARDQLERYWRWYNAGEWSSTGRCFDIGNATRQALERYKRTGDPWSGSTDPQSAGNGCIMRLAPVVMYFHPDVDGAVQFSEQSSRTTHGATECLEACRLLAAVLCSALSGATRDDVLHAAADLTWQSARLGSIAAADYVGCQEESIRSSGYVVHCLEAALWSFASTSSFEAAVLCAVNLGDDADTTAAVCGQIAGAFYGAEAIPQQWRDKLVRGAEIAKMADQLAEARPQRSPQT